MMTAPTIRISGAAMEQLIKELLSDGEVHTLDSLYKEVEARADLGPGDRLKVPGGAGFNKLKALGLDPAQMSPEEKHAAVEEHSLTYELQYQNAVRFALRDFKDRGELESVGRAKYRLLAQNPIAFTAADCELFARNSTSGSFEPLSEEEKTHYRDVRERLKKLAKWAAGASKADILFQGFVSTLSPSGKVPRDMWSCVFPADAPHKSYALQVAIIIGPLGAELCFCLGSGESFGKAKDAADEQRRREMEEEFRAVQDKLGALPSFVIDMVTKGLGTDVRFRKRWRSSPGGSEFSSLQEWLAFASTPDGAGAAVSCYLPPAELEQLGTEVGARFLHLLRSFEPIFTATYEGNVPPDLVTPPLEEMTIEQVADETGYSADEIASWLRIWKAKRHLVLEGPPGTGKTYVAERLARLVAGSAGITELVQFHPAYSYEDFVQGLRPRPMQGGGLDYQLENGRFLAFCGRASGVSGNAVLIIDEINRANVPRVFGELMYLLEYRDRTVPLAAGRTLQVPKNVFIIATMNTADRSIARMDHALRRRFAFVHLDPRYDLLEARLTGSGLSATAVAALTATLRELNRQIDNPGFHVGISYFIRLGIDPQSAGQALQDVWRHEIEPYLGEYFHQNRKVTAQFSWHALTKPDGPLALWLT